MSTLFWSFVAFLAGLFIAWLLENFFFRRQLLQQLETAQETIVGLRAGSAKASQLQIQLDKANAELDACAHARAELETNRNDLAKQLAQAHDNMKLAANDRAQIDAALAARDAAIAQLRAEVEAHQGERTNFAAQLAKFSDESATRATTQALENEKTILAQQLAEAGTQLRQAQNELKASITAKAGADKQLENLTAQLNETQVALEASNSAHAQLTAGIQSRDAELAKLNADIARLGKDGMAATLATKSLEDAKAQLEAQCAMLKAQLAKTNDEWSASINARTNLEKHIAELQTQLDADRRAHDAAMAQWRTQNESLNAQVGKYKADAAAWATTLQSFEGDKLGWTQQIATLQTKLGQANADAQTAAQAKASAEKQLTEARAQIEKANAELSTSTKARAQLEADLKAREAEIARLLGHIETHVGQNKTLTADVAKFSIDAAFATTAIQALEDDKAGLVTQVAQLKADLNACANLRAKLEADLRARNTEIETLRAQAVATPARIAAMPVVTLRERRADDETPFESACPQHLSDVKGIGSVFETRLYAAGIGSFWELAQLSNADLKRILNLTDLQASRLDLSALRADARRLAKQTKSMGRKWNQCEPDDFEPIQGIGHTFEKRLYDAGICTYEALAHSDVATLADICQAPAQFKPDYVSWVKQATLLATQKAKRAPTP